MPVRSLSSSVLKWPDAEEVDRAVRSWAMEEGARRKEVLRIGYIGSYARGDWGVGSDLDLLIIVEKSGLPFERRALEWDTSPLPVPVDLWVYTPEEWDEMANRKSRFYREAVKEAVWVYVRGMDELQEPVAEKTGSSCQEPFAFKIPSRRR